MPIPGSTDSADSLAVVSVAIGQWAVAAAPAKIRTLLGSCVGVVLYDRVAKLGGVAHIVLPSSRGAADQPGKYADTAIPAVIAELERRLGGKVRSRLIAKLVGGANMFQTAPEVRENSVLNIGQQNQAARPPDSHRDPQGGKVVTIPLAPRSTWPSANAPRDRCSWPGTGGGWTGTAPGGSSRATARRAGIGKQVTPHTLRHAFITAAQGRRSAAAGRARGRLAFRSADHDAVWARGSLDRHATYIVAAYLAGAAR